jgi:FtsX-like permease family/YjbR
VRDLCLALPEAFELKTWDHPTFRVGSGRGRIFCTAAPDGSTITLKADPLEREALIATGDPFSVPPYVGDKGWLGIRSSHAGTDGGRLELIATSYCPDRAGAARSQGHVAPTHTGTVRRRGKEMALLKSVAATPTQVGQMIVGEVAVLSVIAALAAITPALLAGRVLLEVLKDAGQIAAGVPYRFGPIAIVMGLGITFAAATIASAVTARASALMPIILFTATTGALYMQSIENAAPPVVGTSTSAAEAENIETLNFVVVGMIAAFAAIILINTLVAATTHRRQEFAQLRLAGATPPQVLRVVSLESIVLLVTGVVFGTVAALFTIVPYSIARTGSLVPDSTAAIYLGVVGAAAMLALASGVSPVRRAIRAPAIEAVAA